MKDEVRNEIETFDGKAFHMIRFTHGTRHNLRLQRWDPDLNAPKPLRFNFNRLGRLGGFGRVVEWRTFATLDDLLDHVIKSYCGVHCKFYLNQEITVICGRPISPTQVKKLNRKLKHGQTLQRLQKT